MLGDFEGGRDELDDLIDSLDLGSRQPIRGPSPVKSQTNPAGNTFGSAKWTPSKAANLEMAVSDH